MAKSKSKTDYYKADTVHKNVLCYITKSAAFKSSTSEDLHTK